MWSENARLLRARAGDRKVADVVVEGEIGSTPVCRTTERVTRDPNDFGIAYDGELKRVGSVVAVKGGGRLIEWERRIRNELDRAWLRRALPIRCHVRPS